jgi:hypothetical protein
MRLCPLHREVEHIPRHMRHHHVAHDQIEIEPHHLLHPLDPVLHRRDHKVMRLEQFLERVRQINVVIEQQDALNIQTGCGIGGKVVLHCHRENLATRMKSASGNLSLSTAQNPGRF